MARYWLGVDCGSVSVKAVLIDEHNNLSSSVYLRNQGLTRSVPAVLKELRHYVGSCEIAGVGITGSGRELVKGMVGGDVVESEILAHYVAATELYECRTIFDIGGEDCKLMVVKNGALSSFSMNRDCGGGTGAMIESIATRLGIDVQNIGDTALNSTTEVSIPSKCGIFAQSAVVSKINKGVPAEDILMGVCRGLVGNFFTMLAKGVRLEPPYIFQGATARNKALVRCFEEELQHEVIVPEHPELMGALGMAIISKEQQLDQTAFRGWTLSDREVSTRTYYAKGCTHSCEITEVSIDGCLAGCVGNRCEKCVRRQA